ncbi:hypothetical protein FA592_11275 [Sulfurospirillum diekertiae]|uniref:Uncharacterized protein n=1 Tax=Sulfurospirillum diekertiae TaxID=1854492 RepID=A0A6G9VUV0_9BACT|nr:hypothetical protein [Sulfurospirillum diekertiae]QIR76771.1 hypothetical protein FA584_11410 [Sulfurospirillum diekertiae]QIR79402.1 hypothetical protein FA592_11275 [Sulfurospirillum diekertiae]
MPHKDLERYLETFNEEFKQKHIEHKRRPFEFISRYSTEFNQPVNLSSNFAKYIFEWFEKRAKEGAHSIGSLYTSAYYYDAQFWELSIPVFFGTVKLNSLDSLKDISDIDKEKILKNEKQKLDYVAFWSDCIDYAMGFSELRQKTDIDSFGKSLLLSANEELRSATNNLLSLPVQKRAILNCRAAVETSLKAYIALKRGLTEKEAKKFNHNLFKPFDETIKISGNKSLDLLRNRLKNLPNIEARYEEQTLTFLELWNGYVLAQCISSFVIRDFTGHNSLSIMLD